MDKVKNINKYFFVWGIVCLAYMVFIGVLTWLYPYGADEMVTGDFHRFINSIVHTYQAQRLAIILNGFVLQLPKIFFVILNSFAQLFLIFSTFYLIYMRFPRLDSFKDFAAFLLLLVLGTFFIVQPSDTILWVGGALNYLWVFILFVWFAIYLRKLEEGKHFTSKYVPFLCVFCGILLGFINENNSPMILCLMIVFAVYAHFKKIILRKDFWILLITVAVSVTVFFAISRNDLRMQMITFGFPMKHTIWEKLLMHLSHMNSFAEGNLWFIYLLPLFLFLLFLDKRKELLKDKNFYLSCICWAVAFGLSIVLCEAPRIATRAFYSASWFCIFSFLFMLLEIEKLYKIKAIKFFAFIFVLLFLYIAPLFALEVYSFKNLLDYRQTMIDKAKQNGREMIYLGYLPTPILVTENLSMTYYDCLMLPKDMSKVQGITIKNQAGDSVRTL